MLMKIRKHIQYICSTFLTVFSPPLYRDTISDQVGHLKTPRKSAQDTVRTLGLAAASNLQRSVFETSNEKNNL